MGHSTPLFEEQNKSSTRTYPQCWLSSRDMKRTGSEPKPTVQYPLPGLTHQKDVSTDAYTNIDRRCRVSTLWNIVVCEQNMLWNTFAGEQHLNIVEDVSLPILRTDQVIVAALSSAFDVFPCFRTNWFVPKTGGV